MEDILHIDMDAFYASVEQRDHPEYKGKPLVVSGDVGSRSVISTASYEARKYNIFSAMPLAAALKKCPDIIIINPDFKKYASASDHIKTILHEYSPEIEQASIDEFYLNISGSHLLFGSSFEIAKKIQSHIKKELQLTCSIGISYNKLLAKMASNIKKPEGITHITGSNLSALFDHLEIEKIPGLGKKAALKLHMINVFTIKELKKL
ncbi:MAG: DNA polymerase IV, partial [Spirochaetes bacterium]|nr:DNA polymerase IV [Spirochaetota bacterium]